MNIKHKTIKKGICAASLLALAATSQAQFNYNSGVGQAGDLLLCFRPTLVNGDNLVIDAGPVTSYVGLTAGTKITNNIAAYVSGTNATFLSQIGTNGLSWSALAAARYSTTGNPRSLWVTRPRTGSLNVQTTAWPVKNGPTEGTACSTVDSIGLDAVNISAEGSSAGFTTNSLLEFPGGAIGAGSYFNSYSFEMDSSASPPSVLNLGNLGGNFWGDILGKDVEQSTGTNFTSLTYPSRADFYELDSSNTAGLGTYLGVFDFLPSGQMVFTAGTAPAVLYPAPTISIVNNGVSNIISCSTSVLGAIYTLHSSTNLLTAINSWGQVGVTVSGTGSAISFTDTPSTAEVFYSVSVH